MTGEHLSEIRELLRTYRPAADPDRQGELLTAAQGLFGPARRGMRLESRLRRLLADWDRDVARKVCADMLRSVLEDSGVPVDG